MVIAGLLIQFLTNMTILLLIVLVTTDKRLGY